MNKQECKKYLIRAYRKLEKDNKSLNEQNIEYEMKNIVESQITEYIAYSKIAIHNMKNSGNLEITLKDLLSQIDILPRIYNREEAINLSRQF